ncbi:hypothetical protein BSKO_02170 [Bryopsis sp. KO-2023]|nr:hypothetical protein BSKO_02170 [Bryopsis sp. KO-2023]
MAFCARARRDTFSIAHRTPKTVGPGSYIGHQSSKANNGFAPFNTSSNRAPIEDTRFLPGPGYYGDESKPPISSPFFPQPRETGAFVSTSSRFHEDKSTQLLSPGPGTYKNGNKWIKDKHRYKIEPPKRRVDFHRVGTVPSVPARNQSYGYEEDDCGSLIMQPPPSVGHTGVRQDAVGPGDYKPNISAVKTTKVVDFGTSKSRRTEFKTLDTPGPGMYNLNDTERKENLLAAIVEENATSCFVSRTKMGHQKTLKEHNYTPGPGSYNPEKSTTKHSRSIPTNMQFFNSTQHRSFQQDPTKMHAVPMIYKTPGPGTYDQVVKKPSATNATPNQPQPKAGFSQTASRFDGSETAVPGPGNYEVNTQVGLAAKLKKQVVSRGGVFGSSGTRIEGNVSKDAFCTPGPGNYSPAGALKGMADDRKTTHSSSVFVSASGRFRPPKGPTQVDYSDVEEPDEQPRGDPALLGPGSYILPDQWNGGPRTKTPQSKKPFMSTCDRFKGMSAGRAPGPGEYNVLGIQMKPVTNLGGGFTSKESRFRVNPSYTPGPGHYRADHFRMMHKSFNVTIDGHLIT